MGGKFKWLRRRRRKRKTEDEETAIGIELDRSKPVYLAGECITGSLVFMLPLDGEDQAEEDDNVDSEADEDCPSQRTGGVWAVASLLGSSYSRWKEKVPANPRRKKGAVVTKKVGWCRTFLYSQRTLLGKLYETGPQILRKGTTDVQFGDHCESIGTILLPEETTFEEDSPWRIRVCYDKNEKGEKALDGVCVGEIDVDLLACIQSGTVVEHELYSGVSTQDSNSPVAAKVYTSFQVEDKDGLCFRVHSVAFHSPSFQDGSIYVQLYNPNGELFIDEGESDNPENPTSLIMTLPFSIELPRHLPSSVSYSGFETKTGKINYSIGGLFQLENQKVATSQVSVYVVSRNPLPVPKMLLPVFSCLQSQNLMVPSWRGMRNKSIGSVNLLLRFDKRIYFPGETIDLTGSLVTNNTSESLMVYIKLRKRVDLTSLEGDVLRQESLNKLDPLLYLDSAKRFAAECLPKDTWKFEESGTSIRLPIAAPTFLPPTRCGSGQNWPIRFSYTLQLSATKEAGQATTAMIEIPILICNIPDLFKSPPNASLYDFTEIESVESSSEWCQYEEEVLQTTPSDDMTLKLIDEEGSDSLWPLQIGERKAVYSVARQLLVFAQESDEVDNLLDSEVSYCAVAPPNDAAMKAMLYGIASHSNPPMLKKVAGVLSDSGEALKKMDNINENPSAGESKSAVVQSENPVDVPSESSGSIDATPEQEDPEGDEVDDANSNHAGEESKRMVTNIDTDHEQEHEDTETDEANDNDSPPERNPNGSIQDSPEKGEACTKVMQSELNALASQPSTCCDGMEESGTSDEASETSEVTDFDLDNRVEASNGTSSQEISGVSESDSTEPSESETVDDSDVTESEERSIAE